MGAAGRKIGASSLRLKSRPLRFPLACSRLPALHCAAGGGLMRRRPLPRRVAGTRHRIETLRALLVVLVAFLQSEAADAQAPACASWPFELSPLPTLASSDPVLARWGTLRAQELKRAARTAETSAPARANRLWRHLLCLEPASDDATQGVERTRLVRVHRPEVVAVRTLPDPESTPALSRLEEAIRVVAAPAPRAPVVTPASTPSQPAPAFDWTRMDAALGTAEAQLGDANFEAALAVAERLRQQLRDTASTSGARERQARVEVVAATAEIALGREDAARKSFERALAADPKLRLDPAATSPKVRRTFDAALGAKGGHP